MKRINIEEKEMKTFIGCWDINDVKLMNGLVEFFENNLSDTIKGVSGDGEINTDKKNSIDLAIKPKDLKDENFSIFLDYFKILDNCFKDYLDQWDFLKTRWKNMHVGPFNIQKYEPGGHFNNWHTEKDGIASSHRALAWMTYLNNLDTEGGNTDFKHFDLSIKPERGKTLIWPAEWTHAHRGQRVMSDKYIITGWFHFPPME